jgi:hypothetical protein
MKKILSLSVAAALAMGFAACSSEDVPQPQNNEEKGIGAYYQLTFTMPTSSNLSRADYDADQAESSNEYVLGKDSEYKVNKVFLYFFKEDGTLQKVKTDENSTTESDYVEYGVIQVADGTTTEYQKTDETYGYSDNNLGKTWSTDIKQIPYGLSADTHYHVYALCNTPYTGNVATEEDLLNSQLTFVEPTDKGSDGKEIGIPMAARSVKGKVYADLYATVENVKSNPARLDYEVERSYARIAFTDKTFTVPLYNTLIESAQKEIGKVTIIAYQVFNQSKDYYTYRHVGNIDASTFVATPATDALSYLADDGTAIPGYKTTAFGPITAAAPYVIDPNTSKKTTTTLFTDFNVPFSGLQSLPLTAIDEDYYEGWYRMQSADDNGPKSIEYVAENCMQTAAQKKAQSTGIIFCVHLEPTTVVVDAKGTTATPQPGQSLYYRDGVFYSSLDATGLTDLGLNKTNLSEYGVRFFKYGYAYYEYYIRHLNNGNNNVMGQMEFAIVRNNSYELHVDAVAMSPYSKLPGDEVPDPTDPDPKDPIDEDKPNGNDDDESAKMYMQIDVTVRPWIVRTNNMTLGH